MGSQASKKGRSDDGSKRPGKSLHLINDSARISANSLDLIYIDNYFNDKKYLELVAKQKKAGKNKAAEDAKAKRKVRSDTAIKSQTTTASGTKVTKSAGFVSKTMPSKGNMTAKLKPSMATPTKTLETVAKPSKSMKSLAPPATKTLPPSSLSTGNIPRSRSADKKENQDSTDKIAQNASWHAGVSAGKLDSINDNAPLGMAEIRENLQRLQQQKLSRTNPPLIKTERILKPRSILTTSTPKDKNVSDGAKRQRSYVITKDSTLHKSNSLASEWTSAPERTDLDQTKSLRGRFAEASLHGDDVTPSSESDDSKKSPAKKKLIVRGLRNYVNTRKRDSSSSMDTNSSFSTRRMVGGGGPAIWKREFPSKSKFHPDNYIYDWPEGPNAPTRPFSAMARCKKHGGRCNDCGLFTGDLCQSCRKCENDCGCPISRGNNPYSPTGVYDEIFGGDGWTKVSKVLCDLTEQDKRHPVGGNASKRRHNMDENFAKNNVYKSQIDVLNPYNVPLNDAPTSGMPPPLQYPMFAPPMYPMPVPFMPMPMMGMPPPMMPYYSPPLYPSYDQCYAPPPPPPCPYPTSDCFMPVQNY